jgi:hypothetical protein
VAITVLPGNTVTAEIGIRNIGGVAGTFLVEVEMYYPEDDPSNPGDYMGRFDYPLPVEQTPVVAPGEVAYVTMQKRNWWSGNPATRSFYVDILVIADGVVERWFSKQLYTPMTEVGESQPEILSLGLNVTG